jgi:NhaA family Na+:H+ antiporter
VVRPFQDFFRIEASSGILLLAFTGIALFLANSPWAESYFHFWETELAIVFGDFHLSMELLHWINDGLMAIFFFLVGLEIKREILIGELSSPRKAILPIFAAIGGMLFPALIYLLFNLRGDGQQGWGIPMATDIAFALGVLALLGSRVPTSLKVFLTALAIVDDLGAVVVIAVFYTEQVMWAWLVIGVVVFLGMLLLNRLGVRHPVPYGALGIVLWFAFLQSGVHATISGVLAALTIPAVARMNTDQFVNWSLQALDELRIGDSPSSTADQRAVLQAMETAIQHVESPLQRLEHAMEMPVAYTIMPLFALANAGVPFLGHFFEDLVDPVALGIVMGLVFGKQIGITLFTWLAVRLGLAELPQGVSWRHIYGVAWLGGIGFTMALFIDGLAFEGDPLLETAKIGILTASIICGVVGYLILRTAPVVHEDAVAPEPAPPQAREARPAQST